MKSLLLSVTLVLNLSIWAQIPNSSFENWSTIDPYFHPETEFTFSSTNQGSFYTTGLAGATEVIGNDSSALRLENLLIGEDTLVSFAIFGESSDAGGLIFSEGISFTEIMPDTARMHVKYNLSEALQGSVFFQFFYEDELVTLGAAQDSLYVYSLAGIQEEWDTLNIDFTLLEFSAIPDECVIGYSCGDIFLGKGTPGSFLEIDNLELVSSSDTLLISDFDTWSPTEAPLEIDEWTSVFNPASSYIFRSEDSSLGNYSLGLMNQAVDTTIIQASVFLAELSNFGINPNLPLPQGAFMLKFKYKYETLEPDSARVSILLSEDSIPETLDITRATQVLYDTTEWTEVLFEFGSLSDSANYFGIEFFSGPQFPGEPADSSVLLIDQVEILSIDSCGFNPEFMALDTTYCPEELIDFSATNSESYIWFIKESSEELYTLVSDSSEFGLSYSQPGDYSYFLIAEQEECFQSSDTLEFSVTSLQNPLLTADGLETVSMCANSNLELSISNASVFSQFIWNLGTDSITSTDIGNLVITGMEGFAGTYTVEAQSSVCALQSLVSNQVNISTYPLDLPVVFQNGNTLSAQSFSSYQWWLNGQEIPGAISQFYNPLEDGSYAVNVVDEFGCEFLSEEFLYSAVGVSENRPQEFSVYPNPARDVIYIEGFSTSEKLEIINSAGQKVLVFHHFNRENNLLDISKLTSGSYVLRLGVNAVHLLIE
ncbi:MAG: T9SS type A sorting domain-containing protein [Flavobacteriales bacterium]